MSDVLGSFRDDTEAERAQRMGKGYRGAAFLYETLLNATS